MVARRSKSKPRSDPKQNDNIVAARDAGLRYTQVGGPGIRRVKSGKSFRYVGPPGKRVSADDLNRIKSLVIPPAWTEVWICPFATGHIQAVGFDVKGRKQYRYHPQWHAVRDEDKYGRMLRFVAKLPKIRRTVARHLRLPDMPREKVLAAVVRLLETTLIRVGNDQYARDNQSYGLTTLRNRHVKVRGGESRFQFRGKSGVEHAIDLQDKHLAKIIRKCQDLPGEELFGYEDDDGAVHDVGSADVNAYLQEISGEPFTAKDFRTWAGTVLAATALKEFEAVDSEAARKRNVVAAIESVAKRLGNTKAVCRKCYVHPVIIESYMDGSLVEQLAAKVNGEISRKLAKLPGEEVAVLVLLQKRLKGRRTKAAA